MFKMLKAAQVLGWYGRYPINGINGSTVLTPPPDDVKTARIEPISEKNWRHCGIPHLGRVCR